VPKLWAWRLQAAFACAPENHACHAPALQNGRITLQGTVQVSCRLDAWAASGQGLRVPIPSIEEPSRTGVQSKQRGRERWRRSACRDRGPQRFVSFSTLGCARPWGASVRRSGSPARSAWFRHGSGMSASRWRSAWLGLGCHGTGRPRRWHKSSTASYTLCRVSAAHRSRALPLAPQAKQ